MNLKRGLVSTLFISALSINSVWALPIDWTGAFGVDTHMINNTCRTSDDVPAKFTGGTRNAATRGTQGISGDCNASFQSYIFKLNPQIIVNDGVTLKGELSSGYSRGGFAGGDTTNTGAGSTEAASDAYSFATPAQNSALNVNQMYMELYADTALIKLGRFAKGYGLGVMYDTGSDAWDRFFTMYDGAEAEMKIGNFSLIPYYAKISSNDSNNKAQPNGTADVRELGVVAKYDNKNRDIVASILYSKRSSETRNNLYNANSPTTDAVTGRGKTSVTIIDPFVSKKWNKFKIAVEAPIIQGDYGDVYQDGTGKSKIAANAYIIEAKYDLNPKWDVGANIGQVSGDKGSTQKFEAAYLHPNYQVADLMFRYHYSSFSEGQKSIFDNSITNTRYYRMNVNYKTDKWTWKGAFILASAMSGAKTGRSYHHEENYSFTSTQKQKTDLGYELDFGFDYRWNPNVTIGAYYGYWKVGDYYSFSNTNDKLGLSNVHGGGLRATLEF